MSFDPKATLEMERIKRESADWIAARERGLTADEQDRFFSWLAADPRHSEVLAKQQQVMQSLKKLALWRPEHAARPNPDLLAAPRKSPRRAWRWLAPLGLAAALVVGAGLWWRMSATTEIAAESPIIRKVLEDGSTIDLNHGAQVEVSYSPERRSVRLLYGEATFKVAKNKERPFVVSAGGVSVQAVGTAFNVNFQAKSVAVLVTEGRVRVTPPAASDEKGTGSREQGPGALAGSPSAADRPPVFIDAGERTVIGLVQPQAPRVEAVPPVEMARVLAWQPRQLEFTNTPLAQVLAEFNASNQVKLVIDDPELASMPIDASLRSDNVEGFVRILEQNFGIRAERRDSMIMLRRGR